MINLTGKSIFVKTQEEYLSVLKMAKFQGFTWGAENNLKQAHTRHNPAARHISILSTTSILQLNQSA